MTLIEQWESVLSLGCSPLFSPSGQALAVQSLMRENFMATLEVHFDDGRAPLVLESDRLISPCAWASDTEFVYRMAGESLDDQPMPSMPSMPSLHVLSVEDGTSRLLLEQDHHNQSMSIVPSGRPGYVSVLTEPQGKPGLFDLDVRTGQMVRRSEFDTALAGLEVYPLFDHAWSEAHEEVAFIGWRHGDYLQEGIEPTPQNSQWSPVLDTPAIQDTVVTRPDGTTITQRDLTAESKRRTPPRLFILRGTGAGESGDLREVPGTEWTHHPLWSPDGTLVSFERFIVGGDSGVWLARRDDLSLLRLGDCSPAPSTLMHPSGVLLANLEDASLPSAKSLRYVRAGIVPSAWREFRLKGGGVSTT
ncbi:MAG: hypothetical protein V4671_05285 [Armatimonadota bacterium]